MIYLCQYGYMFLVCVCVNVIIKYKKKKNLLPVSPLRLSPISLDPNLQTFYVENL